VGKTTKERNMKTKNFAVLAMVLALAIIGCSKTNAQSGGASGGNSGSSGSGTSKAASGKGKVADASNFIYDLNKEGNGFIITGLQWDAKFEPNLIIPSEIEGKPLTEIGKLAFSGSGNQNQMQGVISITIPDTVTKIGYQAFGGNQQLTSINLPKNLKEIPEGFVIVCSNLTTITWPQNLEIIGESAFLECAFTELVIPEGVKEIGQDAFKSNKKLTSVTLPQSIEIIGNRAFGNCSELAMVKLPAKPITYRYLFGSYEDSMGNNNEGTFAKCPKLTSIAVRKAIQDSGYKGVFN